MTDGHFNENFFLFASFLRKMTRTRVVKIIIIIMEKDEKKAQNKNKEVLQVFFFFFISNFIIEDIYKP